MDALRLLIFINSSRGAKKKKKCVCVYVCPGLLCAIACLSTWPHPPARRYQVVFYFLYFSDPKPKYTWDITERRKKKRERQRQTAAYQGQ